MSDPTTLKIDIKNKAISDNHGNSIQQDTIRCNGKPVQLNEQRAREFLSQQLNNAGMGSDYDWLAPIDPAANPLKGASGKIFETAAAIGQSLQQNVSNITVTLNPGTESPLTSLCKLGHDTGILHR